MESGFSLSEVDEWDIFFFFDILLYREKKKNSENIAEFDNMGY